MQANAAAAQVTAEEVAAELLYFWGSIMRGSAQQMIVVLEDLDLTLTQMKALHLLDGCSSELSVKELGAHLGLSLPGASRTVDGLLRRGLVERREDDEDRRMKRLRITTAGRNLTEQLNTARLHGLEEFASTLSPEQLSGLHAALLALPHHHPKDTE